MSAFENLKYIPIRGLGKLHSSASASQSRAAFSRRSGNKWFVFVMNGESEKSAHIDLSFLGEGEYNAMMVQDKKPEMAMVSLVRSRKTFGGQKGVNIIRATATNKESLLVQLISGGGFVAVFSK